MVDLRFKLGVVGVVGALVAGVVFLRFCGDLDLPPKPPPPSEQPIGRANDVMTESVATAGAWEVFLEKDAQAAGVPAPTPATMSRTLPRKVDDTPHPLAVDSAPIVAAGVRISTEITDGEPRSFALVIENLGETPLAYQVVTRPHVNVAVCHGREVLPYNAHVLGPRERERRTECVYRDDMTIDVTRVETLELQPLQAYYLSRVPPAALTPDARLARGHMPRGKGGVCNVMMSQAIRSGLETGEIEWRDLVDFYARHRCESYRFPRGYKALSRDGERSLPAVEEIP